jgi:hypothetical protein
MICFDVHYFRAMFSGICLERNISVPNGVTIKIDLQGRDMWNTSVGHY